LPAQHQSGRFTQFLVVIEHNLDVLAEAECIVDLGPEAGVGRSRSVAQSTPGKLVRAKTKSHTAKALAHFLASR
jgi:excinuclease ABC subunit A